MMENILPPPFPPRKKNMSYGVKIVLLGLQCGVLMFGALLIWLMAYSRDERNKDVADEIARGWGGKVMIKGPVLLPNRDSADCVKPSLFDCDVEVESKLLHRSIYEAEVFDARVSMSGRFMKKDVSVYGDTLFMQIGVEAKQVSDFSALKLNEKTFEWMKSDTSLYAIVDLAGMPDEIGFSTEFNVRGSSSLFIKQVGRESSVTIDGEAANPSFKGGSLPVHRNIKGKAFTARWENRMIPAGITYEDDSDAVGTKFLVGVDRYQKVVRSLKYAFIIIFLTYVSVLFTEILLKRNIPLLNYFLIGAALIMFYSLLLAFSEHMSFGLAYLIGSAMTVILISGYMWRMLGSRRAGLFNGFILVVLYAGCFILLTMSTYALLLGSLILFCAVAAMMYGSLQIKQ